MKIIAIRLATLTIGATTMLAACTKDEQQDLKLTAELQMQYNSVEFVIPPSSSTGEVEVALNFDGTALAQTLAANGYSMDQLKEFRFTNGTVHIESPDSANYNALQSVSVELSLAGANPVSVATIDPVPLWVNGLTLTMPGTNVEDILRNSDVRLIGKMVLDEIVTDTLRQKLDLGGHIVVKL